MEGHHGSFYTCDTTSDPCPLPLQSENGYELYLAAAPPEDTGVDKNKADLNRSCPAVIRLSSGSAPAWDPQHTCHRETSLCCVF
ncbi:hypothetical protein F2P79_020250 [Pimephales promelas]|nr:hypothetical protein F2P79_020250 [Pimephales promelas]